MRLDRRAAVLAGLGFLAGLPAAAQAPPQPADDRAERSVRPSRRRAKRSRNPSLRPPRAG